MFATGYELIDQMLSGAMTGYAVVWFMGSVVASAMSISEQWDYAKSSWAIADRWTMPLVPTIFITGVLLRPFMLIFLHTLIALLGLTIRK